MIILNEWWQVFLAGAIGPVVVELVKLYRLRGVRIQRKYRKAQYWLLSLAILPISGLVACAHGTQNIPFTLALQLGATTPLLLGAYASGTPKSEEAGMVPQPESTTLWDLLSWSNSENQ